MTNASSTSFQRKGVMHFFPYSALKEATLMVDWWLLLWENSTMGNSSSSLLENEANLLLACPLEFDSPS